MRGEIGPSVVLMCVQRLPNDSLTAALMRGGREWFGWTPAHTQRADLFDALNLNTRATGNWKDAPPKLPLAYRPDAPTETEDKPKVSVASLFGRFSAAQSPGG